MVLCVHQGSEPVKPWAAEAECTNLTTQPPGWPLYESALNEINIFFSLFSLFVFEENCPELTSAASPPLFADEDWP